MFLFISFNSTLLFFLHFVSDIVDYLFQLLKSMPYTLDGLTIITSITCSRRSHMIKRPDFSYPRKRSQSHSIGRSIRRFVRSLFQWWRIIVHPSTLRSSSHLTTIKRLFLMTLYSPVWVTALVKYGKRLDFIFG